MSEDSNNQLEEILIALRMAVKKDDEETVEDDHKFEREIIDNLIRIF